MARILVIDDEPLVRSAFRLALERAGHVVTDAESGSDGLRILKGAEVDLVITDLVMAGMDGFQTIMAIRDKLPELPVIAVTGGGPCGPDELVERARGLGIEYALCKPIDRRALIATVDAALT